MEILLVGRIEEERGWETKSGRSDRIEREGDLDA